MDGVNCVRRQVGRGGIHRLHGEKRQILREIRDDAVGGLIGIDAEAGAQHGSARRGIFQASPARGAKRSSLGLQQAVVPSGRARSDVRNRNERQQGVGRRRNVSGIVAGDHVAAAGHRRVDRGHLVVRFGHVAVVFVAQADIEPQIARDLPAVLNVGVHPERIARPWRRGPVRPAPWSDSPAGNRRRRCRRRRRRPEEVQRGEN